MDSPVTDNKVLIEQSIHKLQRHNSDASIVSKQMSDSHRRLRTCKSESCVSGFTTKDMEIFMASLKSLSWKDDCTSKGQNEHRPLFKLGVSEDILDELDGDVDNDAFISGSGLSQQLTTKFDPIFNLDDPKSKKISASCPEITRKKDEGLFKHVQRRSLRSDSDILPQFQRMISAERFGGSYSDSSFSSPHSMSEDEDDDVVCVPQPPSTRRRPDGPLPALLSSQARERSFLVGGLTKHSSLIGSNELHRYFPDRKLSLFIGTWNMQRRGIPRNLDDFLVPKHEEFMQDMYVIGVQEATQDLVKWEIKLQETLGPNYVLAHSVSHGVLHIAVLMRRDLIWFCSAFESDRVTTRMVSQIKTKGAVAVSFQFFGTSLLFVTSHFRSGETRCKERLDDFNKISEKLQLPKLGRSASNATKKLTDRFDCVFWFGDLNFRVSRPREIMHDEVTNPHNYDFTEVMKGDQLIAMMRKNKIFHGFKEHQISFLPTYKFIPSSTEYDRTKQRVPSYTDRILSKSKEPEMVNCFRYNSVPEIRKSDHRPVYGLFHVTLKPANNFSIGSGQFRHDIYQKAAKIRANTLNQSQSSVCNIL